MNAKQRRFCDEYLVDCNATQAAIRAGYSPKTANEQGSRLLANANIKAYIDEHLSQMHNARTADAQEVIEYLTTVMRGQHKEQTLQLVGDGKQRIADIEIPTKDRLKAAELLGKRYALYTDKMDVSGDTELAITVEYGKADHSAGE